MDLILVLLDWAVFLSRSTTGVLSLLHMLTLSQVVLDFAQSRWNGEIASGIWTNLQIRHRERDDNLQELQNPQRDLDDDIVQSESSRQHAHDHLVEGIA